MCILYNCRVSGRGWNSGRPSSTVLTRCWKSTRIIASFKKWKGHKDDIDEKITDKVQNISVSTTPYWKQSILRASTRENREALLTRSVNVDIFRSQSWFGYLCTIFGSDWSSWRYHAPLELQRRNFFRFVWHIIDSSHTSTTSDTLLLLNGIPLLLLACYSSVQCSTKKVNNPYRGAS